MAASSKSTAVNRTVVDMVVIVKEKSGQDKAYQRRIRQVSGDRGLIGKTVFIWDKKTGPETRSDPALTRPLLLLGWWVRSQELKILTYPV